MGLCELKIEITNKCLLRCIHCSTGAHSGLSTYINYDVFKKIIEQAIKLDCQTVYLSGGEPLLHPEISSFLKILKTNGIDSFLYSSGITKLSPISPITNSILENLKSSGLSHIIFSIYSANAKLHDKITHIKGSFETSKIAIINALNMHLLVEINFVVTKLNIEDLPLVAQFAEALGINKISVLRFVPQGRGLSSSKALTPSKSDFIRLREIINVLRKKMPSINFRLGSPFNFLLLDSPTPCTTGSDRIIIDADGFAYPCDALKQVRWLNNDQNNILKTSLIQILKKASLFKLVTKKAVPTPCINCKDKYLCQYGCLAQRLLQDENIDNIKDIGCIK